VTQKIEWDGHSLNCYSDPATLELHIVLH